MTQQDVYTQLLKEADWITTAEIAEKIGIGIGSVHTNIASMRNYGEVESKRVKIDSYWKQVHRLKK